MVSYADCMRWPGLSNVDLTRVSGVVFDIGGVLSLPRATVVADRLRQAGADLGDPRDLSAAAHYRAVRAMHEEHPAGFDRRRSSNWEPYNRTYAQILGLTNGRWSDVVGSTFRAGGLWTEPRCGAIRAAVRLFDARMPIAVVSNNDGTAVDQLNEIGPLCAVVAA